MRTTGEENAADIMERLRNDERYALEFCTRNPRVLSIAMRFCCRYLRRSFENHRDEICYEIFLVLSRDSWSVLSGYTGRSSFYHWLDRVITTRLIDSFRELYDLKDSSLSVSDVNLSMWYLPSDLCARVISCIDDEMQYRALYLYYVSKLSKKVASVQMGMEVQKYEELLSRSKHTLTDELISSDSIYVSLVLSPKYRYNTRMCEMPDDYYCCDDNVEDLMDSMDQETFRERLMSALEMVRGDEADRKIFINRIYNDMDFQEISGICQLPRTEVVVRFFKFKNRIVKVMRSQYRIAS